MRPIDIVTACSWFRTIFVGVKSIGTSLKLNGVIVKFLHETIVEQLDMKVKKKGMDFSFASSMYVVTKE